MASGLLDPSIAGSRPLTVLELVVAAAFTRQRLATSAVTLCDDAWRRLDCVKVPPVPVEANVTARLVSLNVGM